MPSAPPNAEVQAVIALLVEAFPKAFVIYERRRRPLKIGVHLDILATMNGAVTPAELDHALQCYTSNAVYLDACRLGAFRIDLNGEPAGEVSPPHAARAAARLAARRLRQIARKAKLAEPEPKRHGLAALKELGRAQTTATTAAAMTRHRVSEAGPRPHPSGRGRIEEMRS
jgi:ProP effector